MTRGRGMIVVPQPIAGEAGREVLRRGGNAVDAAVTTAFVQGVVDPQMCGLGGSGLMVVHRPADGTQVIEFHARAGALVREDQWQKIFIREAADRYGYVLKGFVNDCGHQSVAVPGTVRGLADALERYGTISWDQALAPAIRIAAEGFPVSETVRGYWLRDAGPDVVPHHRRVQATPEARRVFTKDGELYAAGEVLRQPDLARTMETLARQGPEAFYTGELAERMAADFAAHGGTVTLGDLAGYRSHRTAPLTGSYRGVEIVTAPPPAGGLTLLQMLNFIEAADLRTMGWPSAAAAQLVVRAMEWAFADRERHIADPLFEAVPTSRLAAKEYARAVSGGPPPDSPTTTHVSCVDAGGTAVSLTHTLGASSGVVTPGLGFMFNNYLNCFDPRPGRPNSLRPGKTRVTMMVPTMVFDRERLRIVLGAPGGTKIVGAVLQVLLNLLDHGMSPLEAVSAPRIDFQGSVVEAEGRIDTDIVAGLEAGGHRVHRRPTNYDVYFAKPQVLRVNADGSLDGASDPRGDGGIPLSA